MQVKPGKLNEFRAKLSKNKQTGDGIQSIIGCCRNVIFFIRRLFPMRRFMERLGSVSFKFQQT